MAVVAADQDFRHGIPAVFPGPGVLRVFQKEITERLFVNGSAPSQNAGDQPGYRVYHHHGGQFAARQHIVANRDFGGDQMLAHPFVNTLVMAADQNQELFPA